MTAIAATFSDFRIVKGRKVAQLVFELPLEDADNALSKLGGVPRPDAERWVGIAPLKAKPSQASPEPATRERRPFSSLPRSQQAALACADERFQRWLGVATTELAAAAVRDRCRVTSRAEFETSLRAAAAWDAMYSSYLTDTGQAPEQRG